MFLLGCDFEKIVIDQLLLDQVVIAKTILFNCSDTEENLLVETMCWKCV